MTGIRNKPFRTPDGPKKFSVYTKNDKGNVVKVNFGDPNMEIKRDDPERRKNFRARHNCDNPGPKWKARYWSCQATWHPTKKVSDVVEGARSVGESIDQWGMPGPVLEAERKVMACPNCGPQSRFKKVIDMSKPIPAPPERLPLVWQCTNCFYEKPIKFRRGPIEIPGDKEPQS